ncbi:hypothetical protein ACHAW6_011754 [Cyclotella cf. meneghiniana]
MLMQAKERWSSAVHLCLWPDALRFEVYIYDTVPVLFDGRSQLELFQPPMSDFSPKHASNVILALYLKTGLVPPQFHCRFDDFFETTHYSDCDKTTSANWKQLVGFVRYNGVPTIQDHLSNTEQLKIPIGTSKGYPPKGTQHHFRSFHQQGLHKL